MVFRFTHNISKLVVCTCLLMSCNEGQVTSIKDIQIVWATDYSEDGLDFLLNKNTTYIYPDSSTVLKEDMFFCTLTDQDYSLAKDILKNYFDYYLYDRDCYTNDEPYRLRKYFRQYIGFKMKDSLYVYVNLYTHYPIIPEPECLCTISPSQNILVFQENGGKNYGTAIIDISNKKVISFKMSNADSNYVAGHYSNQELEVLFPHLNKQKDNINHE